jgi:hypothetical protein
LTRARALGSRVLAAAGLFVLIGCAARASPLDVCTGAAAGDGCDLAVGGASGKEVSRCVGEADGTLLCYSPGLPDEGRRFPAFTEKAIR